MSEWKEYKFSDFVNINPPVKLMKGAQYSFVEMKDLTDGRKHCYPNTERELSGGARFNEGDTLFARITPCLENGKISQAKGLKSGVGFGSTEFFVFRDKEGVSDNDFVYYLSRWDEIRAFAEMNFDGTSGRQRVPKDAFNNLFLNLPPLPEQKSIASILSSLDDKIDLLHRQNKTLEALAETLFRQWFVRRPELVEGEEAEEGWEEKGLDDIAEFINGLACQKYPPVAGLESLPVIKIKELRQGVSDATDMARADVPEKYIINDGDILFSWSGSLEVVIWSHGKGVLNQHLFKVSSEQYPEWFFYFWIKHHLPEFRNIAQDKATTMGHIQRHHLSDALVVIPSPDKMKDFNWTFGDNKRQ
ncbi:MAG: restriction endonuclease subunit S [Nitrospirae bacterium]|nr:MAG: restriction endonuclease subunit S [Nitrospirota bacterium]